jgi:hypothetical protein
MIGNAVNPKNNNKSADRAKKENCSLLFFQLNSFAFNENKGISAFNI